VNGHEPGTGGDRGLRRDAEHNRRRIVRAADEVFTERGLDATLDDVARRAGVGVGTVYRRFPGKDALAEIPLAEGLDRLIALAERALAEPDSWAGLTSYMERSTAVLARNRGLRQVVLHGACGRDRIRHGRRRLRQAVTRLFERARSDAAIRSDLDPTDIRLIEFMLAAAAEYARRVRPGIWRRYLALILDGLRPGGDATGPIPVSPPTSAEIEQAAGGGLSWAGETGGEVAGR
jgi:AcrR family transcriptional regulator